MLSTELSKKVSPYWIIISINRSSVFRWNIQQWKRPPVTAGWWSATIGGCRAQQTPMEWLNRLREANSQWEVIPIGNGPRKKWIFESISTNWQWHKFIFIGGSSMPWWNWKVIQRNGWKVWVCAVYRLIQQAKCPSVVSNEAVLTGSGGTMWGSVLRRQV